VVTEFEPNRKYASKDKSGYFPIDAQRLFEPVKGGTRVTFILKAVPGGVLNIAEPCSRRWSSAVLKPTSPARRRCSKPGQFSAAWLCPRRGDRGRVDRRVWRPRSPCRLPPETGDRRGAGVAIASSRRPIPLEGANVAILDDLLGLAAEDVVYGERPALGGLRLRLGTPGPPG
jgi:hypothetical protein